ncbi:MAG: hypothetical protein GY867_07445 [bacterium]|nr:hypothetical protein [bacterium]
MSEARILKRKKPINYLEVYDRNTGGFVGSVVDMTVKGCRLTAEEPLEPEVVYNLKLNLPQPIQKYTAVNFDAVCRWCKEYSRSLMSGSFGMGLEFYKLSPTDRDLIELMLESSWFRDWRQAPDYESIRKETGFPEK